MASKRLVEHRDIGPLMQWFRHKLLLTKRIGFSEPVYKTPSRFHDDQSPRSQPPPNIPGGVHHKIEKNYYADRDSRRSLVPPTAIASLAPGSSASTTLIQKSDEAKVLLTTPTPGFGYTWKRNRNGEEPYVQYHDLPKS